MPKGADLTKTAPGAVSPAGKLLVVVGLSAGGLNALLTLLSNLRPDFDFPIVIVLHLHPDYKSVLASLLAQRTGLRVEVAVDGELTPGVIYVAPPDRHVTMKDGKLKLKQSAPVRNLRPSIDVLFQSAAEDDTLRVVAVVLSGSGTDGAAGISTVKAMGGRTIAQSPETAQFRSMPSAAIATGCVDLVLSSNKIGEELGNLTTPANG